MGFLRDAGLGAATPGTFTSLFDPGDLAGTDRAKRAKKAQQEAEAAQQEALQQAIAEVQRATAEGQGFLAPFGDVGLQGVEQAGFLTDPQAQFDFLQNNPLFQSALDNANRQTLNIAAARGRLSAGDTLTGLSENTLLAASPLIESQKRSIGDLLNFGSGIARAQANTAIGAGSDLSNLFQTGGNITSSGILGRNQIQAGATQQQNQLAAQIFGSFFSDPRLKDNVEKVGSDNGYDIYQWEWNEEAYEKLGLSGTTTGVMATDVSEKDPDAVEFENGFMKVNYDKIGVKNGA